jgi:ABC-type multidrug transport system fused ATPase/permease subunit
MSRRTTDRPGTWAFFRDFPRVLPYVRPHRRLAATSLGLVGLGAATSLLAPWPLAILVDTVLGDEPLPSLLGGLGDLSPYWLLAVAVLCGLLLTGLEHGLAVVDEYVNTKLDQSMVLDMRSQMFRHVQRLSQAFHDDKRTGHLMFVINTQAASLGAITVAIPPLLQSALTLVGMFVVVFLIDPALALLAMVVVPFIYASAGYYARRIQPQVVAVRNLESQSMTIVHEAMAMMRVIAAFGREDHEYRRFRAQGERAVDARVRLTVRQTMFSLVVTMTTAVGTALVLGFGAYQVLQGGMSVGELLVVMGYVASLYKPLEAISHTVSSLQEWFITLRSAFDLLETEPEIAERPGAVALERAAGAVAFEDVSFSYMGRRGTLRDVSFDAPAGSRVAVVGPTGAGKSTLLSLLPRFYDAARGRVLLDGHDVRDLTLDSLRAQISVVHQEPLLFSGSIRDNIRYGRLEATDAEVEEAARSANAHDFITALPKGYDTLLGERGARLSGGERQRVAVARAFLKDAPILILDEPTSAIDSRTEAVILTALGRLMEGRTTFMVAHRLSTVTGADLILVVNEGRVVEQGTHEDLLALGGLYAELHEAQTGAGRGRAAAAVSADGLSELTTAVVEHHEAGTEVAGPALAQLAQAMAADGADPAWRLLAAARGLLDAGSAKQLRALAQDPDEAGALARRLLADLRLDEPAAEHVGAATARGAA